MIKLIEYAIYLKVMHRNIASELNNLPCPYLIHDFLASLFLCNFILSHCTTLAEIELIFFKLAHIVLCSGLVVKHCW